jgi:hypothetical protein
MFTYLENWEKIGQDHRPTLLSYVRSFAFSGQRILNCMSIFLSPFRLPAAEPEVTVARNEVPTGFIEPNLEKIMLCSLFIGIFFFTVQVLPAFIGRIFVSPHICGLPKLFHDLIVNVIAVAMDQAKFQDLTDTN